MKKKMMAIALGLVVVAGAMGGSMRPMSMQAQETVVEKGKCEEITGNNIERQHYATWASTIQSYLCDVGNDELMRVQYDTESNQLGVSYYGNDTYELKRRKDIAVELPVFGGFYQGPDAYFVVSGQNNPTESDETEVFRITKYDRQWKRIGSCSLYGANTYEPFNAGSLRMTDDGTYLFIRTCHTMYMSEDGKHHQANVTIEVDMNKMVITDSLSAISNTGAGYASHSFNQFIRVEQGKMVAVDHGDAFPRSICLTKYNSDASDGTFVPGWDDVCDIYHVIEFPGNIGDNYTGASVGGFEISDTSYLVAGNNTISYGTINAPRNVFIAAVSKETKEVTMTELTSYTSTDAGASTPHLISLDDGTFLLLWSSDDTVYYTRINENGKPFGKIGQIAGHLSDCVPVLVDDKVVWYTVEPGKIQFYEISSENPAISKVVEGVSGHHYVNQGVVNGILTQTCDKCGASKQMSVITEYKLWWNTTGPWDSYSSMAPSQIETGDKVYYWADDKSTITPDDADFAVEISDAANAQIEYVTNNKSMASICFTNPGTYTISIYPKMNPDIKSQITINVTGEALPQPSSQPQQSEKPQQSENPQSSGQPGNHVVLGDYNGDEKVDLQDAQGTLKIALNIIPAPENVNLDVDYDGKISLTDAQMILKAALNIITLK